MWHRLIPRAHPGAALAAAWLVTLATACGTGAAPEAHALLAPATATLSPLPVTALPQAVPRTDSEDLPASAAAFARATAARDIAVLLPYFAPEGLAQAMKLQGQSGSAPSPQSAEVRSLTLEDQGTATAAIAFAGGGTLMLVSWRRSAEAWLVVDLLL